MTRTHSNAIFTDSESEQEDYSDIEQTHSVSYSDPPQPITTDDENLLSPQSSPSPFGFSGDDLSSNEQNLPEEDEDMDEDHDMEHEQHHHQQQQDNYYDPDLYCLRRSNRQKDKSISTVSFFFFIYLFNKTNLYIL